MRRFTSRKFIAAFAAQVAAMAVLFWPEHESAITQTINHLAALVVLLGSALGYVAAEASVDRHRHASGQPEDGESAP